MAAPAGYTELARIGFVDKGTYASGTTYRIGDVVYYNGSTWVALKDNLKGVTPVAGANWKYMARGFAAEVLSAITATDTSGLVGNKGASVGAQALIDAIADKVATKLLLKTDVVSQIVNDASKAASMAAVYSVNKKADDLISDLAGIANRLLFSGDIDKIEFGYEDNLNPSVAKHYIAFWHTNGTKSLLSFNNSNIFYDYWDKTQWFNLWTK